MAQLIPGRELVGLRLPVYDTDIFSPGDVIRLNGVDYVVVSAGHNQVIIHNPRFVPGGDEPRYMVVTLLQRAA